MDDQVINDESEVSAVKIIDQDPQEVEKTEKTSAGNEHDPYFYTNQDLFTSEIYKIELNNLPKFFGLGELRKLITNTLGLNANKVKPAAQNSVFVCFRTQEAKEEGVKILNGYKWKGCELYTTDAKPAKDPLMLKRKKMTDSDASAKVPKFATHEELVQDCIEKLNDTTTPYWKNTYEEQLKIKMEHLSGIMNTFAKEMVKQNKFLHKWAELQKSVNDGFICSLEPFKTVDKINGYRNRCEFTIGMNSATNEPAVGFRLGAYTSGDCSIFPADHCLHISEEAKKCATVFQQFVKDSSYQPFDPVSRTGHYRTLIVRTTKKGHLMVNLDFNTSELAEEEVNKFKESFKEFFVSGPGKELEVTSLNFRGLSVQSKRNEMYKPAELILGEPFIVEEMLGLEFEIAPNSFFQVNTPGAEVLYSTIAQLAAADEKTTVLDICCGTGSIGISLAKDAGQVLGIECVPSAIDNAKKNAARNGLKEKCDFFLGNAQNALQPTIVRAKYDNIVAVLDPPRPGVVAPVLNVIRATWKIKRLVFVACNFESSYKNLVHLAKAASKQTPGDPFLPVRVIPVDLFPHTRHYEVIVHMERKSSDSIFIPKPIPTVVDVDQEDDKKKEDNKKTPEVKKEAVKNGEGVKEKAKGGEEKVDDLQVVFQTDSTSNVIKKTVPVTARSATKAKRRIKANMQRLVREAYAKANGIEDPKKVEAKELVKLFAGNLTPEEFANLTNRPLTKPKKQPLQLAPPKPFLQTRPKLPTPFLSGMQPMGSNNFQNQPFFGSHQGPSNRGFSNFPNNPNNSNFFQPPLRPTVSYGTQTDCAEFLSREELDAFEELGYSWGCKLPDRILHDLQEMRREEEEAVEKFREGFLAALKKKQRLLIEAYQREREMARQEDPFAHMRSRNLSPQGNFSRNYSPLFSSERGMGESSRSSQGNAGYGNPFFSQDRGEREEIAFRSQPKREFLSPREDYPARYPSEDYRESRWPQDESPRPNPWMGKSSMPHNRGSQSHFWP